MKRISNKRRAQLSKEAELTKILFAKQEGLCECGRPLGWGSAKHEIIFRSRGGSPVDESNCKLLCLFCHNLAHGIKIAEEVK